MLPHLGAAAGIGQEPGVAVPGRVVLDELLDAVVCRQVFEAVFLPPAHLEEMHDLRGAHRPAVGQHRHLCVLVGNHQRPDEARAPRMRVRFS